VIGPLTDEREVDAVKLAELIAVASPMRVGFHRAFDYIADQDDALELLVSLQVDHVLTSGGQPTALEGASRLRSLVERAGDRIAIIAGGAITASNVREVVAKTGVRFVHGRAFRGLAAAAARE